jgi:hypothetical protein
MGNVSLNGVADYVCDVLVGAGKWFILSDHFCCVPVNGVPLNHESKTLYNFQGVSCANVNAPPLEYAEICKGVLHTTLWALTSAGQAKA